eukprot:358214-Chlamydomonas_euryale.AAC.2
MGTEQLPPRSLCLPLKENSSRIHTYIPAGRAPSRARRWPPAPPLAPPPLTKPAVPAQTSVQLRREGIKGVRGSRHAATSDKACSDEGTSVAERAGMCVGTRHAAPRKGTMSRCEKPARLRPGRISRSKVEQCGLASTRH